MAKLYTVLKIDEGANLGAIRIRLRSLKAAVNERGKTILFLLNVLKNQPRSHLLKKCVNNILCLLPMLSPIHQKRIPSRCGTASFGIQCDLLAGG